VSRPFSHVLIASAAIGMAIVFLGIAVLFIAAPTIGAALFGIPAPEVEAQAYVRAIGLRDLALGLYILGLLLLVSRRAAGMVIGLTTVIPLGDMLLVLNPPGTSAWTHVLLHGASAAVCVLLSAALLWSGMRRGDN
jgi:hypothetical protein